MRSLKTVFEENKTMGELKGLVEVYQEVAAQTMQRIRSDILAARAFFEGLASLSDEVGSDVSAHVGGGSREAAVLVSANTGLYGEIVGKVFAQFLAFIRANEVDVIVMGKIGEAQLLEYAPDITATAFPLSDDASDEEAMKTLSLRLARYRKVRIFYGKFHNIAVQEAAAAVVAGETLPTSGGTVAEREKRRLTYLYEPDVAAVSYVFAHEILSGVVDEFLRESQLAKQGSRLMHLDRALGTIDRKLTALAAARRSLFKERSQAKQQSAVASFLARRRVSL